MCSSFTDADKIERYALRLANRILPEKKSNKKGREMKRFLSAVTPEGVFVQHDSVVALSEKIITIEDDFSVVAPYIAEVIGNCAIEKGYDVYKCYCPLFPKFKVEHIIVPEIKLSVFTENSYHMSIDTESKRIHASRFFDIESYKRNKAKLSFHKKAKKELIDEAVKKLSLALDIHDRLEEYYIKATDFDVINSIQDKIIGQL